ncbi:MAG TPA: hypothetical protein G4O16_05325 [Dehalococcoidia bacterium]|nr:hypothetical protein [Dehalococcoidia bacterium]
MTKIKYEHLVLTEFPPPKLEDGAIASKYHILAHASGIKKFNGKDFSIAATAITEPSVMVSDTHSHEFDQFLVFIGGNPLSKSLGGEVEICLGEEKEKHTITSSAIVHIPKGTMHCPLTHKRVDKPYIVLDILLAPEYKKHIN